MIYCPQCGNPNFDDANFCDTCGEPLVNPEVYEQMRNQAEMAQYLEAQRQQKQMQAYNKAFRKAQKDAEKAAAKKAAKNAKASSGPASAGVDMGAAGDTNGAGMGAADVTGVGDGAGTGSGVNAGAGMGAASGFGGVDAAGAANAAAAGEIPGVTNIGDAPFGVGGSTGSTGGTGGVPPAGTVPPAGAVPPPGAVPPSGAVPPGVEIPANFPVYKHGCVAQAWDDITESEGWGKRITLLGLVNVVPILNFFVTGYSMEWARQLEEDRVEPMPKKVFGDGFFLQGFYAFVIGLVISACTLAVDAVLGYIPFIGVLASVALAFFFAIFRGLSLVRVAIARELGPGFSVKEIWDGMFSNNFGKAFCATIVPGLIIGAAAVFICGSLMVIFAMSMVGSLINMASMAQVGFASWSIVFSMIMGLIPLLLICYMITMFLDALSTVLTLRATSHYVMRYCPSWITLAQRAKTPTSNMPSTTPPAA